MANRYLQQFQKSFERELVHVYLQAAIGASGAVTISSANSLGIASIDKQATAGQYIVTLQDAYPRLMSVEATQINAAISTAPDLTVLAQDVSGAKTLTLQFSAAGSAADMATATTLELHITLSNTSKSN